MMSVVRNMVTANKPVSRYLGSTRARLSVCKDLLLLIRVKVADYYLKIMITVVDSLKIPEQSVCLDLKCHVVFF